MALAAIEKSQQMAGHHPDVEDLELARQVLDGALTLDEANAVLDRRFGGSTPGDV